MRTDSPWKVAFAILSAFLLLPLTQFAVSLVAMVAKHWNNTTDLMPVVLTVSSLLTIAIVVFVKYKLKYRVLDEINPLQCKWKWAPVMLLATLCGMFVSDTLTEELHLTNFIEDEMLDLATSFWGIISIVIIGPIAEEMVFRSAIIGTMLRHGVSTWVAVIVSAMLFSVSHLNPAQIPSAFFVGILLAILYIKSKSIMPSTICHVINNGLSVIMMNVCIDYPEMAGMTMKDLCGGPAITYTLVAVSAVVCATLYYYYWKRR